jgi:hypothetical protein
MDIKIGINQSITNLGLTAQVGAIHGRSPLMMVLLQEGEPCEIKDNRTTRA